MNRFREIVFVRLPGNRFRRRHMSPEDIRPGITWSRRWTVNLVTAGGARRAVAFINWWFVIFNFENFKCSKCSKKILYPEIVIENVRKSSRSSKNLKLQKKNLSTHMIFSIFDKCNLYQNRKENLAFATRVSHHFKRYLKNQIFTFSKVVGDRSLRLQLPRG